MHREALGCVRSHLEIRRLVKYAGTAVCALGLLACIATLPCTFVLCGRAQTVTISHCRLSWYAVGSRDFPQTGPGNVKTGVYWNDDWRPRWRVEVNRGGVPIHVWRVAIPFWAPMLILGIPTAVLWWSKRRAVRAGHCEKCGYDLTGNVTGRCPECGEGIRRVRGS